MSSIRRQPSFRLYRSKRNRRTIPVLNTASLPDLIFTVLFFFMIVTQGRPTIVTAEASRHCGYICGQGHTTAGHRSGRRLSVAGKQRGGRHQCTGRHPYACQPEGRSLGHVFSACQFLCRPRCAHEHDIRNKTCDAPLSCSRGQLYGHAGKKQIVICIALTTAYFADRKKIFLFSLCRFITLHYLCTSKSILLG